MQRSRLYPYYYDVDRTWLWHPMTEAAGDLVDFPERDLEVIHAYRPAAIFMITCHVVHFGRLSRLLKPVLERFGGWVYYDDPDVTYTAQSIDRLPQAGTS